MIKVIKNYFSNIKNKSADKNNSMDSFVTESIDNLFNSLNEPTILMEVGDDIAEKKDTILIAVFKTRLKMRKNTGFILPPILVRQNEDLQENEIILNLNGNNIINKFLIPNEKNIAEEIENSIEELFYNNIKEIFTNEILEKYINTVANNNSKLVSDLSLAMTTVEIKYILTYLLEKNKSIKNISHVFEKIAESLFIDEVVNIDKLSKRVLSKL